MKNRKCCLLSQVMSQTMTHNIAINNILCIPQTDFGFIHRWVIDMFWLLQQILNDEIGLYERGLYERGLLQKVNESQ